MRKLLLFTGLLIIGVKGLTQTCPQPFFSEYVEGSSNNKAMEIYNPGNVTIDLEDYVVYRFNNGSPTASDSLFPIGSLDAHDVYVFANPSAIPSILDVSDTTHTMTFYNGDDVIILVNRITGDTLDAIGIIGDDPGTNWPVGIGATSEYTLVRKIEITEGTTDWALGATQWDVFPQNTIDFLGAHTADLIDEITADFTYEGTGFDVDFTNASLGITTTYLWDFGDGSTSAVENPTHTFAAEGDYTVCLIVDGPCDPADTICMTVNICPLPEAAYSFISDGLSVSFTNETLIDGDTYLWDFGDGEISLEENPEHTYAAEGDYTVCFVVSNACGADSTCMTVSTCPIPSAEITFDNDGLSVSFTSEVLFGDDIVWDFGDGSTSTDADPTHIYSENGTYIVCFTATNECGEDVICDTITVCDVIDANFSIDLTAFNLVLTNESTGTISTYAWDFGDGGTSTDENPTHTYAEDGEYTICLIISNECLEMDTLCETITINTSGINEHNLSKVSVYPNPFNESVTLNFGETFEQVVLVITDINGRIIETLTVNQSATLTLDLAVEAGVYFVQITAGNETIVTKIIKK